MGDDVMWYRTRLIMASLSLILTLSQDVRDLIKVLTVFQELGVSLKHIESRPSRSDPAAKCDYFVDCSFPKLSSEQQQQTLDQLITQLKEISSCVTIPSSPDNRPESPGSKDRKKAAEVPWFPRSIAELDRCCTNLHKFGHELTPDHPGYGDTVYQERRKFIADVAYNYKYGNPIPRIQYTKEETKTWGVVFRAQTALYPTNACKEYNEHFPKLFEACDYREDNIPQLEDVSRYLRSRTGWQLWPVVGWIPARDFLAALAFRVFPTSQYIRHSSSPFYTPEPDICHELMGHAPLFCDPTFSQFSQEIGLASLGLSDEWIEKMATLYWFTVEFGLCQEKGKPKAYGAGLLSGNQELVHSVSDEATVKHREFNISQALVQKYPETGLQPIYFVAQSLTDMRDKMIEFAKTIPRSFGLKYNPYTQSVEVLDSYEAMEEYARGIHYEMGVLQDALKRQAT